jgi:phytoene dehydrogenase-like protein
MHAVVVVGGGLAGLTAATFAARAGASVTLYERLSELGGRARTRDERGFLFNMGPHALYLAGAGAQVLRELGIVPGGRRLPSSGMLARFRGRLHALPGGVVTMLSTGLLGIAEKAEIARFLASLSSRDTAELDAVPLETWLSDELRHSGSRALLEALIRLTTYCHAPATLSAGAALAQLKTSLGGGVTYLDGGWRALVAALRESALRAGVAIRAEESVRAVAHDGRVRAVHTTRGTELAASCVILTGGPREVSELVDAGQQPELARHVKGTVPVRAACLDVALERLSRPERWFALGIDEPTYFSVHSAHAALAPEGGALIQVARYLRPDETLERGALETELEALVDAVQPGWREHLVAKKLLRDLVVAHDVPRASAGGLRGRPDAQVPGIEGLFVAGDWIGPEGLLADAALASGRAAGRRAAGSSGSNVAV